MKQLHVTSLTKFNKCPADYMYNQSQPELNMTYKGDILNTAVNSLWPLWPWVKRYCKHIDSNIVELERLKKVILEARGYAYLMKAMIQDKVDQGAAYYQETKMVIPYSSDFCIVGSVDFVYNNLQEHTLADGSKFTWWVVEDFKYSTHKRYSDEKILQFDCQRVVYPLMLMNYLEIDEVLFRFNVWDKSNTKQKYCGEKIMKKDYCVAYLDDVMKRFIAADKAKHYPACNSWDPICFYCKENRDKTRNTIDESFQF